MVSSTQDDGPGTLHGQELVHLLRLQTLVDTEKCFFFPQINMFFLTNVDLKRRGQPPKLGLQVAGGHRKMCFLTKIKVLFDQYHQQMMPIPAELDMQVPGRLL